MKLSIILLANLLNLSLSLCQSSDGNYTTMNLTPDDGWKQFNFGQVGEPPFMMLKFAIGLMSGQMTSQTVEIGSGGNKPDHNFGLKKCYLEITDAFCPGDRFELIKLDTETMTQTTILQTPEVSYDKQIARDICDGFPVQCSNSTSNPDVAFNDSIWSSGRVLMGSGNHTVVIKSIKSPYCSGAGFVRIHCTGSPHPHPEPTPIPPKPEMLCKYSEGGFRMVMKPVQGPMAGSVCSALGMKLAEIDNSNFSASTTVAFKCSGPMSTSWIGAWNGQSWAGQEGLGLTVSTAAPGGSINVYNDGKARNILCQEV